MSRLDPDDEVTRPIPHETLAEMAAEWRRIQALPPSERPTRDLKPHRTPQP